ncbi:MAG: hypothetical protein RRX88_06930 [Raoultibacter sp.]
MKLKIYFSDTEIKELQQILTDNAAALAESWDVTSLSHLVRFFAMNCTFKQSKKAAASKKNTLQLKEEKMDNKEKGEYGRLAQALAGLPIDDAEKSSFADCRHLPQWCFASQLPELLGKQKKLDKPPEPFGWHFAEPGEGKSYAEKRAILDKNGENEGPVRLYTRGRKNG